VAGDAHPLVAAAASLVHGEALSVLRRLPEACAGLVYVDPPFNTGIHRKTVRVRTVLDGSGSRSGFAGRRYRQTVDRQPGYDDAFDDYLTWLRPRLSETRRILAPHGSLYFHIDPRESHYCKILLDEIFGRDCFLNEVIWAYDYGGRPRRRWAPKHDVILVYVRDPSVYHFDLEAADRVRYMAPRLQTPGRAELGKLPTDVWWQTIVPTNSRERTGYPTQKPLALLRRIVSVSSRPGDLVVDWCAGSGTTAMAAHAAGRHFLMVDNSAEAIAVMRRRLIDVPGLAVHIAEPA
jgi:site-specific DNA-methyltransferase (adenine-specific)